MELRVWMLKKIGSHLQMLHREGVKGLERDELTREALPVRLRIMALF